MARFTALRLFKVVSARFNHREKARQEKEWKSRRTELRVLRYFNVAHGPLYGLAAFQGRFGTF
jgi:hypothetical protein